MSTAQDTMISTPELLEATLLQLPMRDLLVTAPRISKTWHAVTLSPIIQRALFFETDPSASKRVRNPLLRKLFPPFFARPPPANSQRSQSAVWPGNADAIIAMPWSKAPDAFKCAEASWRRMLVAQPPVQTVRITQTINSFMCNPERHGVLKDSDMPLRMGGLYDLALSFLDDDDTCFRISWRRNTEDQSKMEDEPKMEGDIIIEIVVEQGCLSPIEKWTMDEQFCSDGAKPMEIFWGQWD
ncbi:hypothetical protein B0H14DRAFT_3152041 [Mycena olivaceomarginata]|nr:hypothetical protein B0H14DRAFT_3152041 [Mycena olivaceomarginata]